MTNEELIEYAKWLMEVLNCEPLSPEEEQHILDMYRAETEEIEEHLDNIVEFPNKEEVR